MLMLRNDQEAGYVVPKLMHELEVEIFARLPCFEYWKLQVLNKRFAQLLKSGEFFRLKRERELMKPKTCWRMFDMDFEHFQKLPEVHSDFCFFYGDKESISAGTQLIVIGREKEGIVVWRYELENNKRFKGPAMNTLRVMYGSASRGTGAFFAGGINENYQVVNIAEKYNANTKTWTVIHEMHKRRKYSSGCFLGNKFYVIGGRNENGEYLTCGERYDEETNSWELIPDMLKDMTFKYFQSPPLIAWLITTSTHVPMSSVFIILTQLNTWKKLGIVPVRANVDLGWGVAFKSTGDRLLVIGPSSSQFCYKRMVVYTCRPSPDVEGQLWEELKECCDIAQLHKFIHNCCVMFA